jgi:hypothetical protein
MIRLIQATIITCLNVNVFGTIQTQLLLCFYIRAGDVDIGNIVKNPLILKKESDGKVSFTLAIATIDKETKHSTQTTVQRSNINAGAAGIRVCLNVNTHCMNVAVGIKRNVIAIES